MKFSFLKIMAVVIAIPSASFCLAQSNDDPSVNVGSPEHYWATKKEYLEVRPLVIDSANIVFGSGVDMTDPNSPSRAFKSPMAISIEGLSETLLQPIAQIDFSPSTTIGVDYNESQTLQEQARIYHAYFDYASSFSASLSSVSNKANEKTVKYLILNLKTSIQQDRDLDWPLAEPPFIEDLSLPKDEALVKFTDQYGTHFVQGLLAGWSIAIELTVDKSRSSQINSVVAAFSAWGSSGGLSAEHRDTFSNTSVKASHRGTYGGLERLDNDGQYKNYQIPIGLGGIVSFIEDYNSQKLRFTPSVIAMKLRSYRSALLSHPESYKVFEPFRGNINQIAWGVPSGAIIPWFPHDKQWKEDGSLDVPPGWELLSDSYSYVGDDKNPDNFFLVGSSLNKEELGGFTGKTYHSHTGKTDLGDQMYGGSKDDDRDYAMPGHQHKFKTANGNHTPKAMKVLWLRRK